MLDVFWGAILAVLALVFGPPLLFVLLVVIVGGVAWIGEKATGWRRRRIASHYEGNDK